MWDAVRVQCLGQRKYRSEQGGEGLLIAELREYLYGNVGCAHC